MNRENVIELEKAIQQVTVDAETIVYEAVGKMAEASVGPACAVSTLALFAFNHLDQVPAATRMGIIEMIEDKLAGHCERLEAEGHDVSEFDHLRRRLSPT